MSWNRDIQRPQALADAHAFDADERGEELPLGGGQKADQPGDEIAAAETALVVLHRAQRDIRADQSRQRTDAIAGQHDLIRDRADLHQGGLGIQLDQFSFNPCNHKFSLVM